MCMHATCGSKAERGSSLVCALRAPEVQGPLRPPAALTCGRYNARGTRARAQHAVRSTQHAVRSTSAYRGIPGAPCFLSQLLSDSSAAWTLPAAADGAPNGRAGACVELPRLSSRDCYRRRLSQLLPGWDGASSRELGRESGADTLTGVRSWSVTSGPAAASPGRGDPSRDPSRPACRMTNSHGMPRAGCATLNATPSAASAPAPSSAAPASSAVASPLGALAVPPSALSAIDIPQASPLSRPSGASRAADAVDQRQDPEHNRGDNNQRSIRRFTDRASLAPPVRAAAAARAARFIIFSRQRSASSTFVAALNTHPHVARRVGSAALTVAQRAAPAS